MVSQHITSWTKKMWLIVSLVFNTACFRNNMFPPIRTLMWRNTDDVLDKIPAMVVGHFRKSVQLQLAWLRAASLCLMSWFSSSTLEIFLITASLAYPGQEMHSQENKEGIHKLGNLVHGYRGYSVHVCLHGGWGGADSVVLSIGPFQEINLICHRRKSTGKT